MVEVHADRVVEQGVSMAVVAHAPAHRALFVPMPEPSARFGAGLTLWKQMQPSELPLHGSTLAVRVPVGSAVDAMAPVNYNARI